MKGKKRKKYAVYRIIGKPAALMIVRVLCCAALCALLSGCGRADKDIDAKKEPAVSAVASENIKTSKTGKVTTTGQGEENEEGETSSKTEKTTVKTNGTSGTDERDVSKTTTKSVSSSSQTSEQRPGGDSVTTSAASVSSGDDNTVTSASSDKKDAAASSSVTTTGKETKTEEKVTSSEKKENVPAPETQEYHIYADGYVTKYDELKLKKLTKQERDVYDALSEGIWKMQKDIKVPAGIIKQKDAADLLSLVLSTMPEVNYVKGTFKVSVANGYIKKFTIDYTLTPQEAKEQHRELRAAASKIIGALDADMTDYEKVLYFHDTIITNCVYDSENKNCYNAYGCLVEGRAVCEGYAMAMDYLCEKAGLYSALESGESVNSAGISQSHIWNKINVDGKWYNFDLTWDDPISSFGSEYVRYDYFALTDEDISKSHTVKKNRFVNYHPAENDEMNFFKKNGLYISDEQQTEEVMVTAFEYMLGAGRMAVSVRCSGELFESTVAHLLSQSDRSGSHNVYDYLCKAIENTGESFEYKGYYLIKNDRYGIVTIVMK